MLVTIVDYGSGNLRSAAKAFERVVTETGMAADIAVTADPALVARADRIVLPGVGAFADCKAGLDALPGMVEAMTNRVLGDYRPFLGICVGMQLLATIGREHGDHPGLGWIPGEVVPILPEGGRKVPHMGWNELVFAPGAHPLLDGLTPGAHAYFVHSYRLACADPADVVATVDYGGPVTALVARGSVAGTQFHPEKSQEAGLRVIANFLRWTPTP
jgi:glutamine amidotransferase